MNSNHMAGFLDDKSEPCVAFVLEQLELHETGRNAAHPLFVGLFGVQGSGKTTLASTLTAQLSQPPHSLPTVVLSTDDFYLPYQAQRNLADSHPNNPLMQHRGNPSSHDIPLAKKVFSSLRIGLRTKIPSYDKSAFQGRGDRRPEDKWTVVNQDGQPKIKIVILEGASVGIRPLPEAELKERWDDAVMQREHGAYEGQLGRHEFDNVKFMNETLGEYDGLTDQLDALIHLDAKDTIFVYKWRLEQEKALRESKGPGWCGMTDDQVSRFVDGFYPAYELYTDRLRAGGFAGDKNRQLRMVMDENRRVLEVLRI